MRRSRAIQLAVWFGLTPAAVGCAQLVGLTDDYHLANGGAGGTVDAGGGAGQLGGSGNANNEAGASAEGGASGEAGAAAGATESAGRSGASAGSGTTESGGTSGSGGSSNAGSQAVAGSAGSGVVGPYRVGFSQFHDSASGDNNASAQWPDATFNTPSETAAGDLILVFFGADHHLMNLSQSKLGSGWKLIDQHEDYGAGDGQAAYLMYKIAESNEPTQIVFKNINPATDGNAVQGLLSVYRGVNASDPINDYQANVLDTGMVGTQATTTTPAITTTAPNCLLIAGFSPDTTIDRPVIDTWPEGFVENQESVVNPEHPYPLGWANIFAAERHLPTAGTVPASAFDWTVTSGGQYYGSVTFVLALAP